MMLRGLYYGSQKPCFDDFFSFLELSMAQKQNFYVTIEKTEYKYNAWISLLVLDMVAKAAIINHTQFNGKYGCPRCPVAGETAHSRKVWIYKWDSVAEMRNSAQRARNLKVAMLTGRVVFGVEGLLYYSFRRFPKFI